MSGAGLAAIVVGGDPSAWRDIGFVGGTSLPFRNGAIVVDPDEPAGIRGFRLTGRPSDAGVREEIDGVDVELVPSGPAGEAQHGNTAVELDHVVLTTDSLDRTSAAIADVLGLPLKRVRDLGDVRQGFHRFGDPPGARGCIVEVVESSQAMAGRATPWGLVVTVDDLDLAASHRHVGEVRDAVQPGRRIATVSRDARLGTAVALMSR